MKNVKALLLSLGISTISAASASAVTLDCELSPLIPAVQVETSPNGVVRMGQLGGVIAQIGTYENGQLTISIWEGRNEIARVAGDTQSAQSVQGLTSQGQVVTATCSPVK